MVRLVVVHKRPAKESHPPATSEERPPLRLACLFYRTEAGNEPVREWLKTEVPAAVRKIVGGDIKTVQATWPVDKPLVDQLAPGLWEVRSTHDKIDYRVAFMLDRSTMVLLHGFTKGSVKTRKADLELALKRKANWEKAR